MDKENFFKDVRLPFVECRYSRSSSRQFKPHFHRSFSVGAVDQGMVQYQVGEKTARLEEGALALINPETLHSCNSLSADGRSYYMMYLEVDWCCQVQNSLWQVDNFIPAEKICLEDADLYDQYCTVVNVLMARTHHLLEKEQLLFDLCCRIFTQGCRPQPQKEPTSGHIEWLKTALSENLRQELTLESLARRLKQNPYTLLRRFKAELHVTPHAYRMNCRIEQARKYLQEGMDIAETALECGFFDQSHFHRHFKAMTTVTPQEYRVNFVQ